MSIFVLLRNNRGIFIYLLAGLRETLTMFGSLGDIVKIENLRKYCRFDSSLRGYVDFTLKNIMKFDIKIYCN